jgi:phage tail sheath protein FI
LDDVDLVCAPDIMWAQNGEPWPEDEMRRMQAAVLKHCRICGDRFAILNTPPELGVDRAQAYPTSLRQTGAPEGANGALYYPWIRVLDGPLASERFVPPCGHVAGVYARTDENSGVHKAPANEVLESALDLRVRVSDVQQGKLNPEGVNCIRVFPGRGIRVWGARTLSTGRAWRYVNVRRLFLTAGRWIERNMTDVVFEPHDANLWEHIKRDLYVYFNGLFRQGALRGSTPQEAFYIKCDADLNPPEVRDLGHIVTEIGLAPALPNEFIVVRLIHSSSGISITGPTRPGG